MVKYEDDTSYQVYKYNINIFNFHHLGVSKPYAIRKGKNKIFPGLKYSTITILLGWWSFSFFEIFTLSLKNPFKYWINSVETIAINFSGGEDFTKYVSNGNFDKKTNFVYTNLVRDTQVKIKKSDLEIIIELQEEYAKNNKIIYSKECIDFILKNLSLIEVNYIKKNDLENVFDAIKIYAAILIMEENS